MNRFKLSLPFISFLLCASFVESAQTAHSTVFPSSPAAKATCTVDIASWFSQNPIVANGAVEPADSLSFDDDTNCNFYHWSWQMFLWLTTKTGTDGDLVLNTNPFFDFDLSTGALVTDAKLSLREEKIDSTEEATGNAFVFGDDNLVYFGVHTNQTYAFFTEMNISGKLFPAATQFPTTKGELVPVFVEALANYGVAIEDLKTLTMELKTSWIKASDVLSDSSQYITISATIPKYDKTTDPKKWTVSGTEEAELALVGIHIVGSVKGHPEMVWASFEHIDNAPNDSFEYLSDDNKTRTYSDFGTDGKPKKDWLFMGSDVARSSIPLKAGSGFFAGSIVPNNTVSGGTITSSSGSAITGQSAYRQFPWGTKPGVEPTPPAESNAANNTDIISINQSVLGQLAEGDLRANYFLLGATWTNGVIPPGTKDDPSIVKGSLVLANTTMETFIQGQNCFACHNGNPLGGLSHIYDRIKPELFEPKVIPHPLVNEK